MTKEPSNPRNATIIGNPVYQDARSGSPGPPPPPAGPPPPPPSRAAPLKAGQRIANRYVIQEQIGSGGMGIVYRAIEEEIEREVAMKFIVTDSSLSQEEREAHDERFRREAQALGALPPHPNRVVLYHYGNDDAFGLNFIAMELVRGVAFSSVLEREALTVKQILSYAEQLVMALEDVHATGLVHRDLKPENLILTRSLLGDEQLKLIDFGIAQGHRREPQPNPEEEQQLIGTARYMAPELFTDGSDDDPRVDIYAIGVLLYEMVAGRGPFDHLISDEDDLREVIRHHLESEPAPLTSREGIGELPQGLPGLILTCLARQPDDRFGHASELLQGLRRLKRPRAAHAWAHAEPPEREAQADVWPIPQEDGVPILATAISGSGFLVAAIDDEGAVWLWDVHSGNMVRSLTDLEGELLPDGQARLAFSPGGGLLAVGGRDGSLWIHDIEGYDTWPLQMGEGKHPVALTFDQSGALLVLSTTAGDLELWDVRERKRLARFAMGGEQGGPTQIRSLAFSPDRRSLVAGTELGLLFLWHFSDRSLSGALKASPPAHWPAEVANPLSVVYQDISRDGSFLAVLRAGGLVELWDPVTKERLGVVELPSDERPRRLSFSPDSRQLLVAYDSGTIVLVDAPSRAVLDEVRVPRCEAVNVSYTEDAVPLASIARGAAVQVWDLLRMGRLQTLGPFPDHLLDVTITRKGDRALTLSTSGHIDTWDLLTGRHLGRQPSGGVTVRRLDKAPEPGRVLLCGAREGLMALEGLDRNNLTPLTRASLPIPTPEPGRDVHTYAISEDRRMVALGDVQGDVRIYGYREPSEPEILPGSGAPGTAIAFSPNNQLLAVASADGRLCLWDLASARIEWEDASESRPIHFIAFTPSGRLLSVPRGNDIVIWNLDHKRCVARLEGHTGPIRTMVHGLDGRLLLSSSDDRTARLWDLAQQRPLRILGDHPGPVTAATLGPDLRLLLTTSGPFLSLWRVLDAKLLARCVHLGEEAPGSAQWATFTPEGFHITSHDELPMLGVSRPNSRLPLRHEDRQRLQDPRAIALRLVTA